MRLILSYNLLLFVWRWNRMDIISTIKHFFHEFITFKYSFHGLWIINVRSLLYQDYVLIITEIHFLLIHLFLWKQERYPDYGWNV